MSRPGPGIGTVVAGTAPDAAARRRPSPAPDTEQELSLDRIVRAAIEIADAEGLFTKVGGAFEDGYDLRLDALFA